MRWSHWRDDVHGGSRNAWFGIDAPTSYNNSTGEPTSSGISAGGISKLLLDSTIVGGTYLLTPGSLRGVGFSLSLDCPVIGPRGVDESPPSTLVMSWMLDRLLPLFTELRRMKYFWAWLATCVGVLVSTKFRDMLRQSPFPYLSKPRRNNLHEREREREKCYPIYHGDQPHHFRNCVIDKNFTFRVLVISQTSYEHK